MTEVVKMTTLIAFMYQHYKVYLCFSLSFLVMLVLMIIIQQNNKKMYFNKNFHMLYLIQLRKIVSTMHLVIIFLNRKIYISENLYTRINVPENCHFQDAVLWVLISLCYRNSGGDTLLSFNILAWSNILKVYPI